GLGDGRTLVDALYQAVEDERDRRQQRPRGGDRAPDAESVDGERGDDRSDPDGREHADVEHTEDPAEDAVVDEALYEREAGDVEPGVADAGARARREGDSRGRPDGDRDEGESPQDEAEDERPAEPSPPDERGGDERAEDHAGPEDRAEEANPALAEAECGQSERHDVDVEHAADECLRPEGADDRRHVRKARELACAANESGEDRLAMVTCNAC